MKPSMKTVVTEQLRVVGLAIRWEAVLLCCAFLVVLSAAAFSEDVIPEGTIFVDPAAMAYVAMMVGLVAPLGVWKGENTFGESPLWSAPVDHSRHALFKVGAGWAWLMGLVMFALVAVVLFVHAGGEWVSVDTRLVLPDPSMAGAEIAGPLPAVAWSTPLWQWLVPFAAATGSYLACSALVVGLRRPLIWAAGIYLFLLAVGVTAESGLVPWIGNAVRECVTVFDQYASSGSAMAQYSVRLTSGERVRAWDQLPAFGSWASTTAVWLSVAGAALWAAARRPREG